MKTDILKNLKVRIEAMEMTASSSTFIEMSTACKQRFIEQYEGLCARYEVLYQSKYVASIQIFMYPQ